MNNKSDSMHKVVHVLSRADIIYYLGDGSATKIHNGLDFTSNLIILYLDIDRK